jgi:hypothetical protein
LKSLQKPGPSSGKAPLTLPDPMLSGSCAHTHQSVPSSFGAATPMSL